MKKLVSFLFAISLIALPCISNTRSRITCVIIHNVHRTRVPDVIPDIEQDGNNIYLSSEYYLNCNVQVMDSTGKIVYDSQLQLCPTPQVITINTSGLYSISIFRGDVEYEGNFSVE
jgi:hypothetical protein